MLTIQARFSTVDGKTVVVSPRRVRDFLGESGSAISKAQTIAGRLQRALGEDGQTQSLYIRRLGEEAVARIDVHRDVIKTFVKSSR